MATIAMLVGGAVLNATTFVGGSYLAKYLSGSSTSSLESERKRHDEALEKYQKDYEAYHERRQKLLDWYSKQQVEKGKAARDFEDTDEAFKLYAKTHHKNYSLGVEPKFSDYYKPSSSQRKGEMVYVGGGMLALGYIASKFL